MTVASVKAIAALCQIIAGDNPNFNTMDALIESRQVACHAYYAECLNKTDDIADCMIARPKVLKAEREKMLKQRTSK